MHPFETSELWKNRFVHHFIVASDTAFSYLFCISWTIIISLLFSLTLNIICSQSSLQTFRFISRFWRTLVIVTQTINVRTIMINKRTIMATSWARFSSNCFWISTSFLDLWRSVHCISSRVLIYMPKSQMKTMVTKLSFIDPNLTFMALTLFRVGVKLHTPS